MDVLIFRAELIFLGIKGNTLLNFRGARLGAGGQGKTTGCCFTTQALKVGFKFLHKKPDHLEFLLFCRENKKEIEIMKSFHACSENRGLNRDDGIFRFQIFA